MTKNIRQTIVEVSKLMYDKGMVNAFEGNLSVVHDGKIYITPSSICKGFLTEDMIVATDLEGNVLEGKYRPSSEIKLHQEIYRLRFDIKSVIHAHSPYATAYALANKPIETRAYPEMIVLFGKIPVVPYGTPSSADIYAGIQQHLVSGNVLLLANHGIVAVGKDPYEAFFRLESAESIAKVLILSRQLGGERNLPDSEIDKLNSMRKNND